MAKAKLNPLFVEFSGTMGGFVFKKSRKGEAIISRRPRKSNTPPSEAQKADRARFKEAVACVRAALADPLRRTTYQQIGANKGLPRRAGAIML